MPRFEKEIIRPGVYGVNGRKVVVTQDHIRHWRDTFYQMKKAGLRVPVPWEHPEQMSDEGKPKTEREFKRLRAKLNAGYGDDCRIASDGRLMGIVDIPLASDAERIGKTVHAISPEFGGTWTDPSGREWHNPMTHWALTPRPVQAQQTGFVRLSMDDYLEGETEGMPIFQLGESYSASGMAPATPTTQEISTLNPHAEAAHRLYKRHGSKAFHGGLSARAHALLAKYHKHECEACSKSGHYGSSDVHRALAGHHERHTLNAMGIPAAPHQMSKEAFKAKIEKTMHEFKHGALHSGSKHGKKVKSRKQAIAIALNQARRAQMSQVLRSHLQDRLEQFSTMVIKSLPSKEGEQPHEYHGRSSRYHWMQHKNGLRKGDAAKAAHHLMAYKWHKREEHFNKYQAMRSGWKGTAKSHLASMARQIHPGIHDVTQHRMSQMSMAQSACLGVQNNSLRKRRLKKRGKTVQDSNAEQAANYGGAPGALA